MANTSEDDWEHEHHPTQTTTFYIPIDLSNIPSTHQKPPSSEQKKRPGHPTLLKSRLRALEAARVVQPVSQPTAAANIVQNGDGDGSGNGNGNGENMTEQEEAAVVGEIQITGLHTENPLMVYNGELLSCAWSQSVGTDLFFVKDGRKGGGENGGDVLRELNGVDLLALGSAKLVAKVGRLRPRDDLFDGEEGEGEEGGVGEGDGTGKGKEKEKSSFGETRMNQATTTSTMPSSSEFLSKLNEAKLRRGERNRLLATQTPEGVRLSTEMVASTLPTVPPEAPEQEVAAADDDIAMGGT